ncbi:MAG TPA: maleate cis-trans isomerase [Nocardioidaceae bacterium]|jgi:maleate cis-trans isomerase
MTPTPTVGVLYPGHSAEDDYPLLERLVEGSAGFPVQHTSVGEDAHRVDALLDLGSTARLAEGASALRPHRPHAVVWGCTSGSFVFGWDGAREQADALGRVLGLPASSTSIAFVNAAHHLGLRTVAVAATYPDDVARRFVDFLRRGGLDVAAMSSNGILTAAEVGTLGRDEVLEIARAGDHADADAVLLPDTALHTVAWLEELEASLGKPVLTANQVTAWEGLRLAGATPARPGLGRLWREATPAAGTAAAVTTGRE